MDVFGGDSERTLLFCSMLAGVVDRVAFQSENLTSGIHLILCSVSFDSLIPAFSESNLSCFRLAVAPPTTAMSFQPAGNSNLQERFCVRRTAPIIIFGLMSKRNRDAFMFFRLRV